MATDAVSVTTPTSLGAAIPMQGKPHAESTRRGFWLRWLPTFVGFIAGGALATAVSGRLDSLAAAVVGGALAGAVIGGGQWLVLRRRLPSAAWWIAATARWCPSRRQGRVPRDIPDISCFGGHVMDNASRRRLTRAGRGSSEAGPCPAAATPPPDRGCCRGLTA
jgi:hypothetical protein